MAFPPYGTAVPSLNPWQLSFNGVTMGAGTPYPIQGITGIGDLPTLASGDVGRPREQGELIGLDFQRGRDTVFDFWIGPQVGTSIQANLKTLAGATNSSSLGSEVPLWFQLPNLPLLATMARVRKRTIPYDANYAAAQVAKAVVNWHATDPRLYAAPSQISGGLPTPLGGMTFNATFNLSFGGGSSVTILSCTNAGNIDTRPVLVLTGPMTNPTVANQTTGWSLSFTNPFQSSFTLNAGDTLTVDTDLHTVLYLASGNTVAVPVRSWVRAGSIWPGTVNGIGGLQPGTNTISFTSQDPGFVTGTCAVTFSSAYAI